MFFHLLVLFVTIPVLELAVFLFLGSRIGIFPTLAVIVITALLGAALTKSQGLKALSKYRQALAEGRLPHEEVMDGLMILVAGAVLLTPGFLTDAFGFALLVPACRAAVKRFAVRYLEKRVHIVGSGLGVPQEAFRDGVFRSQSVIQVEAEVVEEKGDDREADEGEGSASKRERER